MPSQDPMAIDNLCNDYTHEEYNYTHEEYNHTHEEYRQPWATPDDWEAHQETIRRLYLDEKRPLKDVVAIMESQYGFRATAKMYKTRLAKWKMLKNRPRQSGH